MYNTQRVPYKTLLFLFVCLRFLATLMILLLVRFKLDHGNMSGIFVTFAPVFSHEGST
jgi:hypothetical protein